jgi:hypothetical protein
MRVMNATQGGVMEIEVLKKKISTYRGDGGRVRNVSDDLLMEILLAWEEWTGPAKGFYSALGVSQKGIASIIGKAKKLRREGHFPAEEFKEVKVMGVSPSPSGCPNIELCLDGGKLVRFSEVDLLIDFLKKAA